MKKSFPYIIGIFLFFSFAVLLIRGCSIISSKINFDYCLEDGNCEEGRVINTENGTITINKQTCLEHNGKWDEDKKTCKFK